MLWGTIGVLLVAVLVVKLTGGAIPGMTRRDQARDGGDSSYAPPLMVAGDSGSTAACEVGDGGWSDSDGDCGSDGGSDGGGSD